MIVVDYPAPAFRMQEKEGKGYIFDALRRSWLLLTPEEWVRQNFVQYLIQVKKYPAELIALEKEILLNGLKKRFDILVFDAGHQPWMLVECKAESVPLSEAVLEQALRYHITVPAQFLVITNGRETRAWKKEEGRLLEINELPRWPSAV